MQVNMVYRGQNHIELNRN